MSKKPKTYKKKKDQNQDKRIAKLEKAVYPKNMKYKDTVVAPTPVDTTWSLVLLNGIGEGDDNTSREGNQISIKKIDLRFHVESGDALNGDVADFIRIMLVHDTQCNGAVLPTAFLLENSANNLSFIDIDYTGRFKVLTDKRFVIQQPNHAPGGGAGYQHKLITVHKNVNLTTVYSANGTSEAEISKGSLYVLFRSEYNAPASLTKPNLSMISRIRFVSKK